MAHHDHGVFVMK